jgi:putative addiction module component (TIGR02574 family)
MNIAELKKLPLNEKLQIIEVLWEDLRNQEEAVPVPEWHKKMLDERLKAVEEGREEILEWDDIKHDLRAR